MSDEPDEERPVCSRCHTDLLSNTPSVVSRSVFPEPEPVLWDLCFPCSEVIRMVIEGPSLVLTLHKVTDEDTMVAQSAVGLSPALAQDVLMSAVAEPGEYRMTEW